jgi:hypothetical protein
MKARIRAAAAGWFPRPDVGDRLRRAALGLAVVLGAAAPAGVAQPVDTDCALKQYEHYAAARERWQRSLTRLIVTTHPMYAEVAGQYMEEQLARIEMRRIAVRFVAERTPEALDTAAPLNQWIALDPSTEQRIAAGSERYAELLRRQERAGRRPPHPDGDALRAAMRDRIMPTPEYAALLARLTAAVEQAQRMPCAPD